MTGGWKRLPCFPAQVAALAMLSGVATAQVPPVSPEPDPVPATEQATETPPRTGAAPAALTGRAPTAVPPGTPRQAWRIVPLIGLTEVFSSNVTEVADNLAHKGWITDLSPGLRIERLGPRFKMFLDGRVDLLRYSNVDNRDSTQRFVDSSATLEALERFLFLDARASVTQQVRDPFGPAGTPDRPTANANRVETRLAQFGPRIQGDLRDIALYDVRAGVSAIRTQDDVLPPTQMREAQARLRSAAPSALVGWTAEASTLAIENRDVHSLDDERLRGSVIFAVMPQLRLSVIGGYDNTDFAGPERRTGFARGLGFAWNPDARTHSVGVFERRYFGNAYQATFQHRTAFTSWRLETIRDVTILPGVLLGAGYGDSANLVGDLLVSSIPDPDARRLAARQRLEDAGLGGASALSSSQLSSQPILFRQSALSGTYLLPRDSYLLRFDVREQRAFGELSGVPPSTADDNRQVRWSAEWVHRLTPLTSLSLRTASVRTSPLQAGQSSQQNEFTTGWATRLTQKASMSLTYRHIRFHSSTGQGNFRESAITALLSLQL